MPLTSSAASLSELYRSEFSSIRREFETEGDGRTVLARRTALLDRILRELYSTRLSPNLKEPPDFCLVALGGFGRQELFPHSDIDLLFLAEDEQDLRKFADPVSAMARALWDSGLRVGQHNRALAGCVQLDRDNLEFSVALLDARRVAGNPSLFLRLRDEAIPRLLRYEGQAIRRDLLEVTRRRHAKYGDTIFHLEPNLKEAPGGLRDYHVANWLGAISKGEVSGERTARDDGAERLRPEAADALRFLTDTRCFLHFIHERDDNRLTYELQERAAAAGIGVAMGRALAPAEWMRTYYRQARALRRLLDEAAEASRQSERAPLAGLFRRSKSALSDPHFIIAQGRMEFRRTEQAEDPSALLRAFEFLALHGFELSPESARAIEQGSLLRAAAPPNPPGTWEAFARILTAPYAAHALRIMHSLGILEKFIPEFQAIDALVVRDFYHRYTVDEHSFMAVENLHTLRKAKDEWGKQYGEILSELERPELLYFSLLLHDVGKGAPEEDHIVGSLRAATQVLERWNLPEEDRETVDFLIRNHLVLSATLRARDLFDPESARELVEKVGTHERLKMLALFTYVDIQSVNPEALTPWKAEMLWRLYVTGSNALTRSLDDDRVRSDDGGRARIERLKSAVPPEEKAAFSEFLDGFPRRYVAAHVPEEIVAHFRMAQALDRSPVRTRLKNRGHSWELSVVTRDRPGLFASLTGTLAAWGANILKADAFANRAKIVLDTFQFVDLHRTLDLNPSELPRLEQMIADVLSGARGLEDLLGGRLRAGAARPKIRVATQVRFEDQASAQSTLLELITADRPGLLYQVSKVLSECRCNIEVALIDTEGQKALDVFYLTSEGKKLNGLQQEAIRNALIKRFPA